MALSTKVAKWTQGKPGDDSTWAAYDDTGNQIKNSWVQDSHGWLYMDGNGAWDKTAGNAYKDNSGMYGVVGDNGYWNNDYNPTKSMNQYTPDAEKLVNKQYNVKKNNLINSLAQGTQAYNTQYNDTANVYADRLNSQKVNTQKEQSQFANNMTSRGLGHSTIAGTGIAGIANEGDRLENSIGMEKSQRLNDIMSQIAQLKVNYQNQLDTLDSSKEDDIYAKALELYSQDNGIANDKLQLKIQQQNADANMLNAQSDAAYKAKLASSGYGSSGYSSSSSGSTGVSNPTQTQKVATEDMKKSVYDLYYNNNIDINQRIDSLKAWAKDTSGKLNDEAKAYASSMAAKLAAYRDEQAKLYAANQEQDRMNQYNNAMRVPSGLRNILKY